MILNEKNTFACLIINPSTIYHFIIQSTNIRNKTVPKPSFWHWINNNWFTLKHEFIKEIQHYWLKMKLGGVRVLARIGDSFKIALKSVLCRRNFNYVQSSFFCQNYWYRLVLLFYQLVVCSLCSTFLFVVTRLPSVLLSFYICGVEMWIVRYTSLR